MRVEEIIKSVEEGINDPHIFKAVFMAGGPGSGKGFVAQNLLGGPGLRTINSDAMDEFVSNGLDSEDVNLLRSSITLVASTLNSNDCSLVLYEFCPNYTYNYLSNTASIMA